MLGADFPLPLDRVRHKCIARASRAFSQRGTPASQLSPLRADSGRLRGDAPGHGQGKLAVAYVARHRSSLPGAVPRNRRGCPPLSSRARRGHQGGGRRRPVTDGGRSAAGFRAYPAPAVPCCGRGSPTRRERDDRCLRVRRVDHAVVPRFFALYAEPTAEGVNAFAQPSWAVSHCPACGQWHREFPLISLPRALLPATVAKLRADGVRGIVIVPYVLSDPAWPMGASITHVDNQRDACHILPASAMRRYVTDTSELGGAQRLRSLRWTSGGGGPALSSSRTRHLPAGGSARHDPGQSCGAQSATRTTSPSSWRPNQPRGPTEGRRRDGATRSNCWGWPAVCIPSAACQRTPAVALKHSVAPPWLPCHPKGLRTLQAP